jgi:hypothetical protein
VWSAQTMGRKRARADHQEGFTAKSRACAGGPGSLEGRALAEQAFAVGLSTILGATPGLDYVFVVPGVELSYALPYVSLGGTLGYLDGINATLAARGRLHLGDAVALTLGARSALLPLSRICWGECQEGMQHWDRALFGGGELGVEGRSEAGFFWRAQVGFWGLLARGGASCTPDGSSRCSVSDLPPGVFITQELTLGAAF